MFKENLLFETANRRKSMKITTKTLFYIFISMTLFSGAFLISANFINNELSKQTLVDSEFQELNDKIETCDNTIIEKKLINEEIIEKKDTKGKIYPITDLKSENIEDVENQNKTSKINNIAKLAPTTKEFTYKEESISQVIPFETMTHYCLWLEKYKTIVQVKGIDGERKIIYQIKLDNNVEVSRKTLSNTIIIAPINQINLVGSLTNEETFVIETAAMVDEINASRKEVGLVALSRSLRLDAAANIRLNEIIELFSHTRPNGEQFWTVDSDVVDGENIAYGLCDANVTHNRFMNSLSHRENILKKEYKSVGVASIKPEDKPAYWVVLFGKQ